MPITRQTSIPSVTTLLVAIGLPTALAAKPETDHTDYVAPKEDTTVFYVIVISLALLAIIVIGFLIAKCVSMSEKYRETLAEERMVRIHLARRLEDQLDAIENDIRGRMQQTTRTEYEPGLPPYSDRRTSTGPIEHVQPINAHTATHNGFECSRNPPPYVETHRLTSQPDA